jgi:hypothetical protein
MKKTLLFLFLSVSAAVFAQQKSDKRGISENNFTYEAEVNALAKGVSWYYNWGQTPSANVRNVVGPDKDVEFVPMIWNASLDADGNLTNVSALVNYLEKNPGVKYLLGFNEPNFKAQANMLPADAAKAWRAVEALAEKYNLSLVAPALNYSGEALTDGRVYQPNDWMDAFIAAYKSQNGGAEPRMDYVALHSYMNSPSAMMGYVENFAKRYNKKVWLTEFCSWEGQVDSLSQQMSLVQKLNLLEQSDYVFRYSWFKAKGSASSPFFRLLINPNIITKQPAVGTLSDTGQLYVNLSGYDKNKYYQLGETILAKDYTFANTSGLQINTDDAYMLSTVVVSSFDLGAKLEYQVEVPDDGIYNLEIRLSGRKFLQLPKIGIYVDGSSSAAVQQEMSATGATSTTDLWDTQTVAVPLSAGRHTLQLRSLQSTECKFNWLRLSSVNAITDVQTDEYKDDTIYDLQGRKVKNVTHGLYIKNGKKYLR